MIWTIAARELRSLFVSPLAWVILAVVLGVMGYFFLGALDFFLGIQPRLTAMPDAPGVTEVVVSSIYGTASFVMLLVVPLLTMRLVADERRNLTLPLLFSAPVSMTEIVLGKFVGCLAFLCVMLLLIALMPMSLLLGTHLDMGVVAAGLLGLFLLVASFTAVGLFMSTLTVQPTVAAIATFGVLLLLWILDMAGSSDANGVLAYLSMLRHYQPLLKGLFDTSDLVYYVLLTLTFIVLSIRRLDAERLQR